MAQLTNQQIRALVQRLVVDTNPAGYGISIPDYTALINDAMFAYADMFPDSLGLSGLLASLAFTANDKSKTLPLATTPPTTRNVTGCFLRNTGTLTQSTPLDILRLQVDAPTMGQPIQYSLESLLPGQNTGSSYIMRLHPIPNASFTVDVYGTTQPAALVLDTDYSVFQDVECRIIARMAAVEAARLLGRPSDFIQGVAATLPDRVRSQMGTMVRDTNPRPATGKPAI